MNKNLRKIQKKTLSTRNQKALFIVKATLCEIYL